MNVGALASAFGVVQRHGASGDMRGLVLAVAAVVAALLLVLVCLLVGSQPSDGSDGPEADGGGGGGSRRKGPPEGPLPTGPTCWAMFEREFAQYVDNRSTRSDQKNADSKSSISAEDGTAGGHFDRRHRQAEGSRPVEPGSRGLRRRVEDGAT